MTITETIQEWFKDPSQLLDEGLDPPTVKSLDVALVIGTICSGFTRVVPDGDGGVAFTTPGLEATHLSVHADGSLEYTVWDGAEIKMRLRWTLKEG